MDLPNPGARGDDEPKNKRRADPTVKKLLGLVYFFYVLGGLELFFLPTNGLLMVIGLAVLLLQSRVIEDSSYTRHYRWLIIATLILLIFAFVNFVFFVSLGATTFKLQTKFIGGLIYLVWVGYGSYCLWQDRPLPQKAATKKAPATRRQ